MEPALKLAPLSNVGLSLVPESGVRLMANENEDDETNRDASRYSTPEAIHALLRTLSPKVKSIVRAVMGGGHPDIDDVHQQALIGLVQALPAYRGECEPLGYARIIAVRAAIAARKRSRVLRSHCDDEAEPEMLEGTAPSPADRRVMIERQTILRDLLAELPTEQSETLALRIIFGLSLEEVAKETNVPVNTVRSRVRLAKDRLKKRIESDERLSSALL